MAQTALSHTEHFFASIQDALAFPGPALLRVYTPSPTEQGFAPEQTVAQAHLAVTSRAMPLFRYRPTGEGPLGGKLDLTANPEVNKDDSPVSEQHQKHWHLSQVVAGTPLTQTTEDTAVQPQAAQASSALKTHQESQLHEVLYQS
jgi:pyruvate/2-oxoacid:ferredoxin oxidoreductase beta subunit